MNRLAKIIDLNKHISQDKAAQLVLLDEFDAMLLKISNGRPDLVFSLRFDFLLTHFEKTGTEEMSAVCSTYKRVINAS